MGSPTGILRGLDSATLLQMRTDWLGCLQAIAVLGQSYALAGRSFSKANLSEVKDMIGEINYAINLLSGVSVSTTYADMSV